VFSIKQVDTYWQYLKIRDDLAGKLEILHGEGDYIQGTFSKEFERKFAEYLGVTDFVGVGNGTDALELILKSLDLPPNGEVIIPNMTFFATYESVVNAGGRPKLVDVNRDGVLEPEDLITSINENTFAVIAVHLTGYPCNTKSLKEICKEYSIKLIEDACQAHNTLIDGKSPGHLSDAAAFSFYPGKNLGGMGDSGGIATNDLGLANELRQLRDHGRTSKYEHVKVGRNSRLDSIQAAILLAKLDYLESWQAKRAKNANLLRFLLSQTNVSLQSEVFLPDKHGNHLFPIFLKERDALFENLRSNGVQAAIQYPKTISQIVFSEDDLEQSRNYAKQNLSLPIGEHLSDQDIERVAKLVKEFIRAHP
jgi:dTDP-4-amino-4,6-dideoxygalactose transaminase